MSTANTNPKHRYLDDIKVGQSVISDNLLVDEQQIVNFAKLFDPQPFHLDKNQAQGTIFGRLIASGWHTAALTMRLMLETFPIANGTVGLKADLIWPNPVYPGDSIHIETEVIDIKLSDKHNDRGTVTIRTETKNQSNKVVQVLTANILVFRHP